MPEEAYRLVGLEPDVRALSTVDAVDAASRELPASIEFPIGALPDRAGGW
jgi:hypothetical protein